MSALDGKTTEIDSRLVEAGDKLLARTGSVGDALEQKAMSIAQRLTDTEQSIDVRATTVHSTLDERTRELNSMLASRSAELSRIIDEQARPLVERYASSGEEFADRLTEVTQASTDRLRAENAALINAITNRTNETLSAIDSVNQSLSGNVGALLDRLGASNAEISRVIETAARTLGTANAQLTETTGEFSASTEKAAELLSGSSRLLDGKVERLTDISSRTLNQVGAIAGRFDEHSRVLASASDLLGAAQSNLASTLEERREALQELSVGLVGRSEQIRSTMRSLEDVIEKAFAGADELSKRAALRLEGGLRNAAENAGKLLGDTEDRAAAAAGLMRESVREAVEDAITRFSGATDEIRRSAAEIRRELEDTRSELKRGAFDLPEETRESAAAMRRAVSDQIKALQELSQIVGQSSRRSEVSEMPRPAPRAAMAQPAPAPRREPVPVAAQPRPEPARPQLRGSLSVAEPAPAKSNGWVSDLLRAASREEETPARAPAPRPAERNPRHVVESLNSLSVDIARAIDHDASVDLWRRYQRGERDVFTRRLYTLKGQQTFDEIKSKYGREPEFRNAVDRYIADFEKLLSDVARNDRDNMMTQTYLTSDTGKVYTMLAHASGRFDRD